MLSAQRVFRYCVYIWVSTILICYTIAVSLGHVPLWLPMISDCAITAPEKYIFRLGFISGANYMFISSLLYFIYFKSHVERDKQENKSSAMFVPPIVSLILAFVASLAVAVVGAVNEREDMNVHEGAALTFFAMLLLYMALTTIQVRTHVCNTNTHCTFIIYFPLLLSEAARVCSYDSTAEADTERERERIHIPSLDSLPARFCVNVSRNTTTRGRRSPRV